MLTERKYAAVLIRLGGAGADKLEAAARERGLTMRQYVERLEHQRVQRQLSRAIWVDLREVRR